MSPTSEDNPPARYGRPTRAAVSAIPRGLSTSVSSSGRQGTASAPAARALSLEAQLKQIERDAYFAVLRAFCAQSEAITWAKERLMTELRKELSIPDDVHGELILQAHDDESIRQICEWRKAQAAMAYQQPALAPPAAPPLPPAAMAAPEAPPSLSVGPRKRIKAASGIPTPTAASVATAAAAAEGGDYGAGPLAGGPLGAPEPSPAKRGGHKGRGRRGGRGTAGLSRVASSRHAGPLGSPRALLGRKVKTKWLEDGVARFYEAVVTDYNEAEGTHALVYDFNTVNESFEWVDLSKMPKDDLVWVEGPKVDLTLWPGSHPGAAGPAGTAGAAAPAALGAPAPVATGAGDIQRTRQLSQRPLPKAEEGAGPTEGVGLAAYAATWKGAVAGTPREGADLTEWVRTVARLPPLLSIMPIERIRTEVDMQRLREAKRLVQEREREIRRALAFLDDDERRAALDPVPEEAEEYSERERAVSDGNAAAPLQHNIPQEDGGADYDEEEGGQLEGRHRRGGDGREEGGFGGELMEDAEDGARAGQRGNEEDDDDEEEMGNGQQSVPLEEDEE